MWACAFLLLSQRFIEFSEEHEDHYDAADGFRDDDFQGAGYSDLGRLEYDKRGED